ncbi:DUF159 domain-containing protein [Cephalotus follicularis]|uniref:DUF159 domain-containing protein n=1 Tax=Cephalotus follicularis TaxID=3775 RepID=A0A1Q3BS70_CEPFO|nr:DUF159 domain-containing protein [Cephalotus follicularis]
MCGRARCTLRADDVTRACHLNGATVRTVNMDRYRPTYNASPGSNLPVVRRDDGANSDGVVVHCMKWGLIPSFTKKTDKLDFFRMFNARSESLSDKASFRRLLPKNRCLVAVEGFYEWKKDGAKKQPYYIHFKDGRPLVFAALYDCWKNSEGETLYTFTIVTTSSSSTLQWLHDRMPVILGEKASTDTWLMDSSSSKFDMLLKPYERPDLVWYPVTPAMGKLSFDGPDCSKEIQLKKEEKNSISKFFSAKPIKREPESKPDEKDLCNKSSESNPLKVESLKEEPETEIRTLCSTEKGEHDSKFSASLLSQESADKCGTKRDYEELLADSKHQADENDVHPTDRTRKKGNLESTGDKQPTLFSYFKKM